MPAGAAPPPVQIVQGQCFQFAVPAGWRVLEEGPFAVVQCDGANTAVALMVGNCGFPQGYHPLQYANEKLSSGGPAQLGAPRPGRPLPGFQGALDVDYRYVVNGVPCVGVATVSHRQGYGSADFVLTAGAAQEAHWPTFAAWLPGLPTQFAVTNGAAWGARGIAQQNLANSQAFGQQLQEQREWSQQLQQQVTDERWAADERRQHDVGEVLTGESWYTDPHGNPPQRLSDTPAVHWVHPDGRRESSDDPSYDPRTAEDPYWQRMQRRVQPPEGG
jgi:hypothetical protein